MRKEQFETELRKSLDSAFFRVTVLSETESTNTYLKKKPRRVRPTASSSSRFRKAAAEAGEAEVFSLRRADFI